MFQDTPGASGKSKRKALAELQHASTLSLVLSTRLQYAVFKIENGWTRQTLSEVENLYYRKQTNTTPSKDGSMHDTGLATTSPLGHTTTGTAEARETAQEHERWVNEEAVDTTTYADFWSKLGSAKGSPPGRPGAQDT
ncbi:hypothetical protein MVES_002225 [Malassezia vespertilionis]|uniref:Uncharacterized protein n=1 Tax=Malassezia vespertilionis TaxID=2020962 RepID=A0A2N1JB93_9BASI|nr:hypothetical protein MVES_002225 [Malassezia vespertilionis]